MERFPKVSRETAFRAPIDNRYVSGWDYLKLNDAVFARYSEIRLKRIGDAAFCATSASR
jgi:hypothetical protein